MPIIPKGGERGVKDVLRKLKKHWITVWLVIVSVLLGTFVTYAIYTEVSTVKRVVTTKSAPKELFSSNCMYASLYERRMPAADFNVNVNNFDLNNPDVPNTTQIQYTLTAELRVKYNGTIMTFTELATALGDDATTYDAIVARATGYSIGKSQENNTAGIISNPTMTPFSAANNFQVVFNGPTTTGGTTVNYETLPGGSISTDRFKVTIPQRDFEKTDPEFYVYVKADPTDTGLTDYIQTLLYGSQNVVATAAWTGTLAESNTNTKDYDFYNYIITGSGSGNLDIMWDPNYFDIDDFFFNSTLSGVTFLNNNSTPATFSDDTHKNWKKVTIVVNSTSANAKTRYEIQLYKHKENTPYTGANNAANYIDCELQRQGI